MQPGSGIDAKAPAGRDQVAVSSMTSSVQALVELFVSAPWPGRSPPGGRGGRGLISDDTVDNPGVAEKFWRNVCARGVGVCSWPYCNAAGAPLAFKHYQRSALLIECGANPSDGHSLTGAQLMSSLQYFRLDGYDGAHGAAGRCRQVFSRLYLVDSRTAAVRRCILRGVDVILDSGRADFWSFSCAASWRLSGFPSR